MTNATPIQSINYPVRVPNPDIAGSGTTALTYSAWAVTGRLIGLEVGSPAFGAAAGSLYIVLSGGGWPQTRLATLVKGIAQSRTYYDLSVFRQVEGASTSGGVITGGGKLFYPIANGDAVGIATSGTYGGTGTFVLYYI